jgi:hypothetical protein
MKKPETDVHNGRNNNVMSGCKGRTYAEKKADLLNQLGYYDVTAKMFIGLTEREIDKKARNIIMA